MSASLEHTDLYNLEPLQPRILLSADAEMLDAEVGTDDTYAAVDAELAVGGEEGEPAIRVYKGEVEEEVFVDPDGLEYVSSDLYRTLDFSADEGEMEILTLEEGDPVVMTCFPMGEGAEGEVEILTLEETDPVVMTCFPMDLEEGGELIDPALIDPPLEDGSIYTMGTEEPLENLEDGLPQETYELVFPAPTAEAEVEILVIDDSAAPAEDDGGEGEAGVVVPPSDDAAAAGDQGNPLLDQSEDLLTGSDALLA